MFGKNRDDGSLTTRDKLWLTEGKGHRGRKHATECELVITASPYAGGRRLVSGL